MNRRAVITLLGGAVWRDKTCPLTFAGRKEPLNKILLLQPNSSGPLSRSSLGTAIVSSYRQNDETGFGLKIEQFVTAITAEAIHSGYTTSRVNDRKGETL